MERPTSVWRTTKEVGQNRHSLIGCRGNYSFYHWLHRWPGSTSIRHAWRLETHWGLVISQRSLATAADQYIHRPSMTRQYCGTRWDVLWCCWSCFLFGLAKVSLSWGERLPAFHLLIVALLGGGVISCSASRLCTGHVVVVRRLALMSEPHLDSQSRLQQTPPPFPHLYIGLEFVPMGPQSIEEWEPTRE